jgi:hypothetical protein
MKPVRARQGPGKAALRPCLTSPTGTWERGHFSHHFWSENSQKLGTIALVRGLEPGPGGRLAPTLYRWQCGHLTGVAGSLKDGKQAVEMAHYTGLVQLRLFSLEGEVQDGSGP